MRQARAAVARGDFAAALSPITEHARRFKNGRLVEEREALAREGADGPRPSRRSAPRCGRLPGSFPAQRPLAGSRSDAGFPAVIRARLHPPRGRLPIALLLVLALAASSCSGTLDVGKNIPHGKLPVDERNPVIIYNDSCLDNWMGEYAFLLANSGGPPVAAIISTASGYWRDVNANASGCSDLLSAARSSGLKNIPEMITTSTAKPLMRPMDGQVDHTVPNNSAGASLIVNLSRQLSLPWRPVVVLADTQMTDVADAYLIDHSVAERVVVVAALGSYAAPNGVMGRPNGELDPWADWIVAQRFQYVQVSAFYDQTADVTTDRLPDLPSNPLGAEMAMKQPNIFTITTAADQVGVLAVAKPAFVGAVRASCPRHHGPV